MEVLIHARRHDLVELIGDVFAYHLRILEAITANAAMPLVADEGVRTPFGAFRVVFGIGHFDDQTFEVPAIKPTLADCRYYPCLSRKHQNTRGLLRDRI